MQTARWLATRDSENRRGRELLIWRFRLAAVVLATAHAIVEPGDDIRLSWIAVALFWTSVVVAGAVLRTDDRPDAVRAVGIQSMIVDVVVVALVLVNNLTDPAEPVYLVSVLAMLEAAVRWTTVGGALGGALAGLAAGLWTLGVYRRVGQPPALGFASMRAVAVLVLGSFFGAVMRRFAEQHHALARVLDSSRDLMVTLDPAGTILAVNAACEAVLGRRSDELIGRDCRDFLDPFHGMDLEEASPLSRHGTDGQPDLVVRRFLRADGTPRWLELSVSADPGRAMTYITGRDVTDRIEFERHVKTSEQRFRSLFDHNPDAVFSFDIDGRFTAANQATERLTGYDVDTLCRLSFADGLIAPDHLDETIERFMDALSGEAQNYDTVLIGRRGERIEIEVTNLPIVVDDEVIGVFGLAKDVTDRRQMERALGHQATHDPLTGLPNRVHLEEVLEEAMASSDARNLTLLFVDLDRFKVVNDSLGHRSGDELLIQVAQRLAGGLRATDILARWAGDEFCVLLANETSSAQQLAIADRLLRSIAEPFRIEGRDIHVSASIGLAIAQRGDTVERLVQMADTAMYDAKRAGRNRISIHERDQTSDQGNIVDLEIDLRRVLESGGLSLDYQPIVEVDTGRIVAVESLLRWPQPDGTSRPPADFIDLAEESGLIRPLTRWVVGRACAQLAEWDRTIDTAGDLRMWVNVSGIDLQDPAFVLEVVTALDEAAIDPHRLVVEVTESRLLADLEQVLRTVDALRCLGVSLAIDDFGTGYSSMTRLHRLQVEACKIDRSFVSAAPTSTRDAAIIRSLTDLGSVFGFDIVGEGVETVEQLQVLQVAGCAMAQGYLLARPCPPEELTARLAIGKVDLPVTVEAAGPNDLSVRSAR